MGKVMMVCGTRITQREKKMFIYFKTTAPAGRKGALMHFQQ
jgi:hypothetical protein